VSETVTRGQVRKELAGRDSNPDYAKAQVLLLPDAGLKGNTHIPFADMNNVAVADLLSKFLAENGLDRR
jgi:hypothetical protein